MPNANPIDGLSDPVVALIRDGAHRLFGSRIERIVLFGSRARGDARPDSDYDVMVFLDGYRGLWTELQPLSRLAIDIFDRAGVIVNFLPARASDYGRRTGFIQEVRSEGRTV